MERESGYYWVQYNDFNHIALWLSDLAIWKLCISPRDFKDSDFCFIENVSLKKEDLSISNPSKKDITIFDLQRLFICEENKEKMRFDFIPQTDKTNYYSISMSECDNSEVNAWIAIYNALKKDRPRLFEESQP